MPDPEDYNAGSFAENSPAIKPVADNTDPLIGRVLDDRYKIVEFIAAGGYGNVYRGLHLSLGVEVAIKIIHKHLTQRSDSLKRLQTEALLLSRLDSPYIVRLMDYGLTPAPYIVMEFFDGMPLDKWLKTKGALKSSAAIDLFMQICQGLSSAHALGFVHRDLKPSNIMLKLEDGRLKSKILDFGIAKLIDEQQRLTSTGEILGSPPYMPPEQWGGETDNRSDLYSLGCIMYEVLSSRPPFEAEYGFAYVKKHISETPRRIRIAAPTADFPDALEDMIEKCMAKSPEQRYQSVDEVVAELERVKGGRKIELQICKERKRKKYKAAVGVSIAVASLAALLCWQHESILGPLTNHFNKIADGEKARSRFTAAIEAYRLSLLAANLMPLQSRQRLHAMRNLSICLRQQGHHKEANELQEQVSEIIGAPGADYYSWLRSMRYHLVVCADKMAFELAQDDMKKAALCAGKHSIAYSEALHVMSCVLLAQGSYRSALQEEQESLRIAEELLEPDDIALAARLNNEGEILRALGKPEPAEKSHLRALEICSSLSAAHGSMSVQSGTTVQPLIIADFNNGARVNNLGGYIGTWGKEVPGKAQGVKLSFAADESTGLPSGKCLQLSYDVGAPGEDCSWLFLKHGLFMKLESADFSRYDTLNISVRGDASAGFDKRMRIDLKDFSGKQTSYYMICGISDRWQNFSIPLDRFRMISDWSHLDELRVVFQGIINRPKTGRVYLDHLFLSNENRTSSRSGALAQMVSAYIGLASIKMQKQDSQGALDYFEKACNLCRQHREIDSLPVLIKMVSLYKEDQKKQEHLQYWNKILGSHLEESCSKGLDSEASLSALAEICCQLREYRQSEPYFEAAYLAREQASDQDDALARILTKWIEAAKSPGESGEVADLQRELLLVSSDKATRE